MANTKHKIGIVDTMFSKINMGEFAIDELKKFSNVSFIRITVPGIKDIAVECKRLIEEENCEIALALGYVGGEQIDTQCAHEASSAIMQTKLLTNKHILEVFVFENETWNETELVDIAKNRTVKHVQNAIAMLHDKSALVAYAGKGIRQGKENEGEVNEKKEFTIALVVADFNSEITKKMEDAASLQTKKIISRIAKVIHVKGSFEIPLIAKKLLYEKEIDAVVALGCVIKGETKHDEVIVFTVAKQLSNLSLYFKKPVGFGIVGPDVTYEQAEERAKEYAQRAVDAAYNLYLKLRK